MKFHRNSSLALGLAYCLVAPAQAQSTQALSSGQTGLAAGTSTSRLAIHRFTATPSQILQGKKATLSFVFSGGIGTISDGVRAFAVQSGVDAVVTPTRTTTYTLTVTPVGARPIAQSLVVTVHPSRSIKGTSRLTYVNSLGETTLPNPSISSIRFKQQDPSGAWIDCGAVADGDGRFHSVERLGAGPYWVFHNNSWFQVNRDELALQSTLAGRPTMPLAGEDTAIDVNLALGEPLSTGREWFYLCAPNLDAAARASAPGASFKGAWSTGMTQLRGSFDWKNQRQLASRQGDRLIALMVRRNYHENYNILQTINRSLLFQPLELSSGQALSLEGPMTEPPTETLDLRVSSADFFQALSQEIPDGYFLPPTATISLERYASTGHRALNVGLPSLLVLQGRYNNLHGDLNLSGFALPNPFQGDHRLTKTLRAYLYFQSEFTAYGAENPGGLGGVISVKTDAWSASSGPLRPPVSQVRGVRINNADLTTPLTDVGLNPVLQWDPPSEGTPYAYSVTVCEVTNEGLETVVNVTAGLCTRETRLTIPEGILETGKSYLFYICSHWAEGVKDLLQPVVNDANSGYAGYLTPPVLTTTQPRPAIQNFTGIALGAGQGISLTWKVLGADSVVLQPGAIELPLEGGLTALPSLGTNHFSLTATNKMGSTECSIEVDPQGKVLATTNLPSGSKKRRIQMPGLGAELPEDSFLP